MPFSMKDWFPWILALIITFFILWGGFELVNQSLINPFQKSALRIVFAVFIPKLVFLTLKRFIKFKQFHY